MALFEVLGTSVRCQIHSNHLGVLGRVVSNPISSDYSLLMLPKIAVCGKFRDKKSRDDYQMRRNFCPPTVQLCGDKFEQADSLTLVIHGFWTSRGRTALLA